LAFGIFREKTLVVGGGGIIVEAVMQLDGGRGEAGEKPQRSERAG